MVSAMISTSVDKSERRTTSFLDLPRELRDAVYTFAYVPHEPLDWEPDTEQNTDHYDAFDTYYPSALCWVNKQIYHEACALFWAKNTILSCYVDGPCTNTGLIYQRSSLLDDYGPHIQRMCWVLRLELPEYNESGIQALRVLLKRAATQVCNNTTPEKPLKLLHIDYNFRYSPHDRTQRIVASTRREQQRTFFRDVFGCLQGRVLKVRMSGLYDNLDPEGDVALEALLEDSEGKHSRRPDEARSPCTVLYSIKDRKSDRVPLQIQRRTIHRRWASIVKTSFWRSASR